MRLYKAESVVNKTQFSPPQTGKYCGIWAGTWLSKNTMNWFNLLVWSYHVFIGETVRTDSRYK